MNKQDLLKTADLARLFLSLKEIQEFEAQLKNIFEHFNKISSVKTDNIKPLVHPLEGVDKMHFHREDKTAGWPAVEELLKLAPETLGKAYKVPPVIE